MARLESPSVYSDAYFKIHIDFMPYYLNVMALHQVVAV
jgi:hypothetical protein